MLWLWMTQAKEEIAQIIMVYEITAQKMVKALSTAASELDYFPSVTLFVR